MTATDKPVEPTLRSVRVARANAENARIEAERLRAKTAKLQHLANLETELDHLLERLAAAQSAKKDLAAIATDETITLDQLDVVTKNVTEAIYGKDTFAKSAAALVAAGATLAPFQPQR